MLTNDQLKSRVQAAAAVLEREAAEGVLPDYAPDEDYAATVADALPELEEDDNADVEYAAWLEAQSWETSFSECYW